MSQQLLNATIRIRYMGYFNNQNARSGGANYGHEAATAEELKNAGFIEIDKKKFPKITKGMLKKWARDGNDTQLRKVTVGMPVGSYILQPSGSQGFPDILILDFDNVFISMECKSVKDDGSPMWNDSLPNPDTIYVLASGKLDETTLFLGKDVITLAELELQEKYWEEVKALTRQYRPQMELLDEFKRGWHPKGRPQNFQTGGKDKTNYFVHPDKEKCERNVLRFSINEKVQLNLF